MLDRIFVKNLPQNIVKMYMTLACLLLRFNGYSVALSYKTDDALLAEHFSKAGLITDIQLKYKENGVFRRIAYIGFESEEMAQEAINQFHMTYIGQSRISVELCKNLNYEGETTKLLHKIQSASKNSQILRDVIEREEISHEKLEELKSNYSFIEYLKSDQKSASMLLATLEEKYNKGNEISKETSKKMDEMHKNDDEKLANKDISDLQYFQSLVQQSTGEKSRNMKKNWKDLYTVRIRTYDKLPGKSKNGKILSKKAIKAFVHPQKPLSLRIPPKISYVAYLGFKRRKEMEMVLLKNKSFLDGFRVSVTKYDKQPMKEKYPTQSVDEERLLQEAQPLDESGCIFIRNLYYSITEDELKNVFEQIGPVADVTLPVSKRTRKAKGYARVTFMMPEHAVRAMNELDGTSLKGRVMHILPSIISPDSADTAKNIKEKKEEVKKKTASSWHNWNTLFLAPGAVIDIMSKNYNMSKMQLLDSDRDQSVGVNLALGETQIVEETKRFLDEGGVSLQAFSDPSIQRSSTVILAKNLPARTSAHELKDIFEKHGELGRLILPPSGVTAIIEFLDPGEAKTAFRELAYAKFNYQPLYLEWAPISVFKSAIISKSSSQDSTKPKQTKNEKKPDKNSQTASEEEEKEKKHIFMPAQPNTTIFIKNLNKETTEESIQEHFSVKGEVCSVLISRTRGQSQGYGFVQFMKTADAKKALVELQGSSLDGNNLVLKFSEKKLKSEIKTTRMFHQAGDLVVPKIHVKNIPFQATRKEVRQIFQPFGEIKDVRLPNKVGGEEHRGFGFVEFNSEESAMKAMDALGTSTHLYGRRLVLEWAKDEESVEELRQKTARQFIAAAGAPFAKKQKVEISPQDKWDI